MPAPWVRYFASPDRWADPPAKGNISLWERANTIPDRIRQSNHARAVYDKLMDEERQRIANENAMRRAMEDLDQARQGLVLAVQAQKEAEQRAAQALEGAERQAPARSLEDILRDNERMRAMLRARGIDPD